jgi:hypothetical protein
MQNIFQIKIFVYNFIDQHSYTFQQFLSSSGIKNMIQQLLHVINHHAGKIMTETVETCHCDNVIRDFSFDKKYLYTYFYLKSKFTQ